MSQEQLRRMLADSAEQIEVGPVPASVPLPGTRRPRVRALVAGAALVAAAVVVGAVVVARSGDERPGVAVDGPQVEQLPLLTGPPLGDVGNEALISGRLVRDARGCAVLGADGNEQPVLWPGGWTAYDVGGRVELRDGDGRVRLREGDWVEAGGGYGGFGDLVAGQECAPGSGAEVALVQSEPEVVAPTPLPLLVGGTRPGTGPSRDFRGVLRVEADCLLLREDDGAQRLTIWPVGWSGGTDPDGVTSVRDGDGLVVATTGEPVRVTGTRRGGVAYGGAYDPLDPGDGSRCGQGAVFVRGASPTG